MPAMLQQLSYCCNAPIKSRNICRGSCWWQQRNVKNMGLLKNFDRFYFQPSIYIFYGLLYEPTKKSCFSLVYLFIVLFITNFWDKLGEQMISFQVMVSVLALRNSERKEKSFNNWSLEGTEEALGIRKWLMSLCINHFPTSHPLDASGPSEDG